MKKILITTAMAVVLAAGIGLQSAAAQSVNFDKHGFRMWVPDRYRADVTNNADRRSFGYTYGTHGYGSIKITVASNKDEYSEFQREKGFHSSRWRSVPMETRHMRIDGYHEGDVAIYRVHEYGKTFIKALGMASIENRKLITIEYSAPDIDNGRNRSDVYDIMRSIHCYDGRNNYRHDCYHHAPPRHPFY